MKRLLIVGARVGIVVASMDGLQLLGERNHPGLVLVNVLSVAIGLAVLHVVKHGWIEQERGR